MALKFCITGDPGQGKSLLALSAVELGPLALADTEYRYDWYLDKTEDSATSYRVKKHVCELLGLTYPSATVYRFASQDLGDIKAFFKRASEKPEIMTLVHDSASVTWDLLQDAADDRLPGGLKWAGPKRIMRRTQYDFLKAQKHYICIGHLRKLYDKDMNVVGEKPWIEGATSTSMQHWFDIIAKVQMVNAVPRLIIMKETTAGLVKVGQVIDNPRFKQLIELIGTGPTVTVDLNKLDADKIEDEIREDMKATVESSHPADKKR